MSSPFEEDIIRSLRRITRAIDLHSSRLTKVVGLTVPQLVCMRSVESAGRTRPSDVARDVTLSQATVTGIVDRLVKRGFVSRERDTKDRRVVWISLTNAGREALANAPSALQESLATRLASLPVQNQQIISAVLDQIVSMMEADDIPAARVLSTGPLEAPANDGSPPQGV